MGEIERTDGSISLPKFALESSLDLGATLSDLGMSRAFSPSADFSGMADTEETGENLSIDSVFQKTSSTWTRRERKRQPQRPSK